MPFDPSRHHHRRSYRLAEHDYAAGGTYFVTICTYQRRCVLGGVRDGAMVLSALGRLVESACRSSAETRREIDLDEFVIMPNHFHGLVVVREPEEAVLPYGPTDGRGFHSPKRSLGSFVRGFKATATARARELTGDPDLKLWQDSYYERVMRNERESAIRRQYIIENPMRWADDDNNPANW